MNLGLSRTNQASALGGRKNIISFVDSGLKVRRSDYSAMLPSLLYVYTVYIKGLRRGICHFSVRLNFFCIHGIPKKWSGYVI